MIFRIVEITMELEIFKKAIEVEERTLQSQLGILLIL